MKHRIKVVVDKDATSDGETAKAWLQYDTDSEKTIKECRRAFAKQLGLAKPDELELFIEGRALLKRIIWTMRLHIAHRLQGVGQLVLGYA